MHLPRHGKRTSFFAGAKTWIIIRPYIIYNTERLQLGAIEKDIWLCRALHGKSIPLPKDVDRAIAALIGNNGALQEAINLDGTEHMTWGEFRIYILML